MGFRVGAGEGGSCCTFSGKKVWECIGIRSFIDDVGEKPEGALMLRFRVGRESDGCHDVAQGVNAVRDVIECG